VLAEVNKGGIQPSVADTCTSYATVDSEEKDTTILWNAVNTAERILTVTELIVCCCCFYYYYDSYCYYYSCCYSYCYYYYSYSY